jgi:eIF-2B alpha/beta/delta-like uncharacterized protein
MQFAATRPTARNLFWAVERMQRRCDELLGGAAGTLAGSCLPDGPGAPGGAAIAGGPAQAPVASPMGNWSGRTPGETPERDFPPPESCFLADGRAARLLAERRRAGKNGAAPSVHSAEGMTPCPEDGNGGSGQETGDFWRAVRDALVAEAIGIGEEDVAINRQLGMYGGALIPDGARVLTHCNAGALATAGYGTALGVIRAACEAGKKIHVWVDETRPVLQGARLTAWELMREGIPCTLITDSMAGFLMKQGKVDLVIVGADRISANGDAANKIGTYALAVLARAHGIPFYIAAPLSTIDPSLPDGEAIPIEERSPDELTHVQGVRTAPDGVPVWNPAFDVTPHALIAAIVTEEGILRPPFSASIARACSPA